MQLSREKVEQLHHKYAPNEHVYDLVYGHCQVVAEIAVWCAGNIANDTEVDVDLLRFACLIHDVGSYAFFDDEGKNLNGRLYSQHAILGAKILADEGVDEAVVRIVETHLVLGLTKQEIIDQSLPLPERSYEPQTVEGELLCYADRFHSKLPVFNAYDTFLARLTDSQPLQAQKFETWSKRFGVPDVQALAHKYGQPIR